MFRIGQSSDIHILVKDRDLILGGVKIEHELGLLGHSDADCLLHAIAESIIGAMGLGDLGTFFPDNDPKYKDMSSLKILEEVNKIMINNKYRICNIDSIILIQRPKMAPHIPQMRKNISDILNINIEQVNVKATTGEKIGFVGREEGVNAQAVCLLESY